MSKAESDLIQIFFFNLGLLVAMGTQEIFSGHFKIKIYGLINCFLLYTFLKKSVWCEHLEQHRAVG